jgi:ribonuclease-3
VSSAHLYQCALELNLGEFIILGRGEDKNGGRQRKTVLANAFEALLAAIFLDGGMDVARSLIHRVVLGGLDRLDEVQSLDLLNHKSVLQERVQALGLPVPRYHIIETSGPEHAKVFTVEARVGDQLATRATGSSKKAASQQAAELMIQQLHNRNSGRVS